MGGGRDNTGALIYKRVDGRYVRVRPLKYDTKKIMEAQTHEEIKEFLEWAGLYYGLGRCFIDDVPNLDTAKELTLGWYEMRQRYGAEMYMLMFGDSDNDFKSAYAHAEVGGSGKVSINPEYYGKDERVDYSRDVETGFHPKGMSDRMLMHHEYAHILQDKIAQKYNDDADFEFRKAQMQKFVDMMDTPLGKLYSEHEQLHNQIFNVPPDQRMALVKRMNEIRKTEGYFAFSLEVSKAKAEATRVRSVAEKSEIMIESLFTKLGYKAPRDIATALTGTDKAYASKNWSEAHAECVADFMTNGRNASPVSIKYVRAMEKLIGTKEY